MSSTSIGSSIIKECDTGYNREDQFDTEVKVNSAINCQSWES